MGRCLAGRGWGPICGPAGHYRTPRGGRWKMGSPGAGAETKSDPNRATLSENRAEVALGAARLRSDPDEKIDAGMPWISPSKPSLLTQRLKEQTLQLKEESG